MKQRNEPLSSAKSLRFVRRNREKLCSVCLESVPVLATKCRHCGSYQDWRGRISPANTALALLVALVSVVSMAVPIVKESMTRDNSELIVRYLDRADVTLPVLVSNKGSRPAVIHEKAALKMLFGDPVRTHILFLTAIDQTRADLLIPEGSGKQYFYLMDIQQYLPGVYENLAAEFKNNARLRKCVLVVSHIDFQGDTHNTEVIVYDDSDQKWVANRKKDAEFVRLMAELECKGKIPQPVRRHYDMGS